ncbi:hypothetical protein D9611_012988 [Ephemerocybe angulata]|uniref:Uncharacterized protein n=1 Tax=Ephemerocybe angulata TaxID=980116 RepID=A0A8H5AUG7_9AGAR|nr:hypothetical protein D9611_012988 [Tulosesus angulatus]
MDRAASTLSESSVSLPYPHIPRNSPISFQAPYTIDLTPFPGRRYIVSARRSPHLAPHAGDRIYFCCDFVVHVERGRHTMDRRAAFGARRTGTNFGRIGRLGGAQGVRMGYGADSAHVARRTHFYCVFVIPPPQLPAQVPDPYYARSADAFLSCLRHADTPNASATAALAAFARILNILAFAFKTTVLPQLGMFWGLSGLKYAKVRLSHSPRRSTTSPPYPYPPCRSADAFLLRRHHPDAPNASATPRFPSPPRTLPHFLGA